MSGHRHWLRELPADEYELELPEVIGGSHQGVVVITQPALDSVAHYEFSIPTGPSAGRVYRKNWRDPDGVPDQPYLMVVVDAPDGDGQLHVPCRALVVG